jgi:outer membrane protein assembly factor BamD (BamD/ComL family)
LKRVLAPAVLLLCIACVPYPLGTGGQHSDVAIQKARAAAQEKKYAEAMTAYQGIIADSPTSTVTADALFELALLHAAFDNPHKDYSQASAGFDEFLKRYPDHAKAPEARNWRAVLKALQDTKKENERLRKNIEQLKNIDIMQEEKRKK